MKCLVVLPLLSFCLEKTQDERKELFYPAGLQGPVLEFALHAKFRRDDDDDGDVSPEINAAPSGTHDDR